MCSITPRRIAVIGSDTSPVCSGAGGGAGAAGFGAAATGAAGVAQGLRAQASQVPA